MKKLFLLPAVFMMLVVNVVFAQQAQVTRDDWLASMEQILPSYFCQSDQYFRQCFDVEPSRCADVVTTKAKECLSQSEAKIPDVLNQPQDGTRWGTVVGRCVGTSYEVELSEARISNARCNNPNNWC